MSAALGSFRNNLKNAWRTDRRAVLRSITAWVLFSAIIVVFVFWGLTPQHQGVAQGGAAIQVNDQIVSLAEYSEQVEMMDRDPRFEQLKQLGNDFVQKYVRQQAIQALVDQRLLGENLSKIGITTPDALIRDSIMEIPAFQDEGRFSRTRYLGYLQASRQEAGSFEEKIRRQLAVGRAARVFSAALKPLPYEQERLKAVEDKKANAEAVSFPTETLVIPESLPDADVKAFLAKSDSEGRVKSYYDTHKNEFGEQEKARVRHILVKDKAQADAIEKDLKNGGNFEEIAKAKSEDPGSKANGGLIDFFARGAMVPEFENYAFSGKVGEISSPIKTQFGYHIIKIEDRKAASQHKLEDVRDQIAEKLLAQERSREEIATLDKALVAGDAAGIQAFVAKHKLTWTESGNVSLNAEALPKVGGGDEAVTTAFQLTAAKPYPSKLIRQGPQAILMRYKAPTVEPKKDAAKTAKDAKGKPAANPEENPQLMAEAAAARRGEEAFGQWIDGLRKSAKISVNPQIAGETAAAQ